MPQVFVHGELIGGSDIASQIAIHINGLEMLEDGSPIHAIDIKCIFVSRRC